MAKFDPRRNKAPKPIATKLSWAIRSNFENRLIFLKVINLSRCLVFFRLRVYKASWVVW